MNRRWTAGDVVAYGCVVIAAFIEAGEAGLKQSPELSARMPSMLKNELWGFVPLLLLTVAALVWLGRQLWGMKYSLFYPAQGKVPVQFFPPVSLRGAEGAAPIIGLFIEKSWFELAQSPEVTFKLKLRLDWMNEGDPVHIGKPRWFPRGMHIQGPNLGYSFKPAGGGQKDEVPEIDLPRGYRCQLWLGLDPTVGYEKAEQLRRDLLLGVLLLPVKVGENKVELMIRL